METPGWRQGLGKVKNIVPGQQQRGERESKYLLKEAAKNQSLKGISWISNDSAMMLRQFYSDVIMLRQYCILNIL